MMDDFAQVAMTMLKFNLEGYLEDLARFQCRHSMIILLFTILFTIFMLVGFLNVQINTDLTKSFPQDLPVIKDQNMISQTFGGSDTLLVLFQIDKKSVSSEITDIRDPRVIRSMIDLQNRLSKRNEVGFVQSAASVFISSGTPIPATTEGVSFILGQIPGSQSLFNRDYTATVMIVSTISVNSDQQIRQLISKINGDIGAAGVPSETSVAVTGVSPLRSDLLNLLVHDTIFTTIIAAILILVLIFVLESFSPMPTAQIFWPIVVGVIWTYGLMGWLDISLDIITATVGAMLIGLDVEYGTFMVRRIQEEWNGGKSPEDGIVVAVPAIGRAIIGSGGAMIIGFGVLAFSTLPLIQHLGIVLSLGIFFRLLMSVFINPAIIFYAKQVEVKRREKAGAGRRVK